MKACNTPIAFLRTYHVIVKRPGMTDDGVDIQAKNRRDAVTKALNWFWYAYHGSMGPAHKALTVDDPYREVVYGPKFVCSDRAHKLLDAKTIARVIRESKGELEQDMRPGRPHFPPCSVKRIKRRRDFGKFIAPCLKRMKNGVLYYRIILKPQISRDGVLLRKGKYKDVRLTARTLPDALDEIRDRRLNHISRRKRKIKVRRLRVLAHVMGVVELDSSTQNKYRKVLLRYEMPPGKASIPA